MKKQVLLTAVLTIGLLAAQIVQATTFRYIRTEPASRSSRQWNKQYDPLSGTCPCPTSGNTCQIKEFIFNPSQSYSPTFVPNVGWTFEVQIPALVFEEFLPEGESTGNIAQVPSGGVTFLTNEWDIEVTDWPEHPEYVGVRVHLAGATINSAGMMSVLIPL